MTDDIARGKAIIQSGKYAPPPLDRLADITPRTTAQHRNTPGQVRCNGLRCCGASSTRWPMRCGPAAWSVRNG
jgi:hypothetical protein